MTRSMLLFQGSQRKVALVNLIRRYLKHLRALLTFDGAMNETWFELKERIWRHCYMDIRNRVKYGDKNFPKMITLETQTVCNRRCHYCPNSHAPMEFAQMSRETFHTIVQRMKDIDFCGFVVLSSFSEPLLDPRLTEFVRHLKQEIPRCRPAIFTNADYLDAAKCRELIEAGASYIHITRHPPFRKEWDEKVAILRKQFPKHIQFRGVLEGRPWLFNFSGLVPNPPNANMWTTCQSVKWNVTIHWNGDFPLCANLPLKKPVFGNLVEEDWMTIFRRANHQTARAQAISGKPTLDVCKACYDRSADAHLKPAAAERLRKAKAMFPEARAVTTMDMIPKLEHEWNKKQHECIQDQEKGAELVHRN